MWLKNKRDSIAVWPHVDTGHCLVHDNSSVNSCIQSRSWHFSKSENHYCTWIWILHMLSSSLRFCWGDKIKNGQHILHSETSDYPNRVSHIDYSWLHAMKRSSDNRGQHRGQHYYTSPASWVQWRNHLTSRGHAERGSMVPGIFLSLIVLV